MFRDTLALIALLAFGACLLVVLAILSVRCSGAGMNPISLLRAYTARLRRRYHPRKIISLSGAGISISFGASR